jgi:hypothetical protein
MEAERLASEAKKKKVEGLFFIYFIYFIYLFLFILVAHPNPCSLPPEWEERCRKIEEEKIKRSQKEGRDG